MHLRFRELDTPSNPPIYPLIDINDDVLFSLAIIKSLFTSSYTVECNIDNCYVGENSI